MKSFLWYFARFLFFTVTALIIFLWAKGIYYDPHTKTIYQTGVVFLGSYPEGADIFIDTVFFGKTPSGVYLPSGTYQVELKKIGYTSWFKTIEVYEDFVQNYNNILLFPDGLQDKQETIQDVVESVILKKGFLYRTVDNEIFFKSFLSKLPQKIISSTTKISAIACDETEELFVYTTVNPYTETVNFSIVRRNGGEIIFSNSLISPQNKVVTATTLKQFFLSQEHLIIATRDEIFNFNFKNKKTLPFYRAESEGIYTVLFKDKNSIFSFPQVYFLEKKDNQEKLYISTNNKNTLLFISQQICEGSMQALIDLGNHDQSDYYQYLGLMCGEGEKQQLYIFDLLHNSRYDMGKGSIAFLGEENQLIWYQHQDAVRLFTLDDQHIDQLLTSFPGQQIIKLVPYEGYGGAFIFLQDTNQRIDLWFIENNGGTTRKVVENILPQKQSIVDCLLESHTLYCLLQDTSSFEQLTVHLESATHE